MKRKKKLQSPSASRRTGRRTSQHQLSPKNQPENSFGIFCLGCAQNQYDAELITELLARQGYGQTDCQPAENIIILSCSVRQTALDRIWGKLRLWPDKKIYVIGCLLNSDKAKIHAKYPQIEILSAPEFVQKIPRLFPSLGSPCHLVEGIRDNKRARAKLPQNHSFVPIQSGCDNFCTYCAVPLTRGREISRPASEIIQEIKKLIKQEKSYITLVGQNVNSYGLSREQKMENIQALRNLTKNENLLSKEQAEIQDNQTVTFSRLLWQIEKIPGLKALDFISANPQDITDETIGWMKKSQKFTRKLNLPLQSGSDKILKKMNRRYTAKQYLGLAKKIKKAVPEIKLTTDMIVGFPSETKKDFEQSYDLCRQIGFKQIYIGKYSPRAGTVAEKFFKDDVPWLEKKRRWQQLNQLNHPPSAVLDA